MQEPLRRANKSTNKVPVNSYYGQRSSVATKDSPFLSKTKKKSAGLFIKLLDSLIVIVIAGAIIYSLIVRPHAKLSVTNLTFHSQADYQKVVDKYLASFKNRNKITFDQDGLSTAIRQAFPEVEQADIELPVLGERPVVVLSIGKPAFFINSNSQNYLLSANGVAVGLRSAYPNVGKLTQITDKSGFSVTVGKPILSTDNVKFLNTMLAELSRKQVPIKELVLPNAPEEADLYTSDSSYYTKFYLAGDALIQSGQFLAMRNTFTSQPPPSTYLDVRVAGKVFYK